MVININPNRINTPAGGSKASERRRQLPDDSGAIYKAPTRADINHIPAAETLRTMISSAVEALRRGVTWDRGTILNLLV
jgi:hypothetical protein